MFQKNFEVYSNELNTNKENCIQFHLPPALHIADAKVFLLYLRIGIMTSIPFLIAVLINASLWRFLATIIPTKLLPCEFTSVKLELGNLHMSSISRSDFRNFFNNFDGSNILIRILFLLLVVKTFERLEHFGMYGWLKLEWFSKYIYQFLSVGSQNGDSGLLFLYYCNYFLKFVVKYSTSVVWKLTRYCIISLISNSFYTHSQYGWLLFYSGIFFIQSDSLTCKYIWTIDSWGQQKCFPIRPH